MLNKLTLIILLLVLLFASASSARADTVQMKNGSILKGAITWENDTSVTIDIGIGEILVLKSELDTIERTDGGGRDDPSKGPGGETAGTDAYVPASLYKLSERFQEVKERKRTIENETNKLASLKEEISGKKAEFDLLIEAFEAENDKLKKIDPGKDLNGYNKAVGEVNSMNAKFVYLSREIRNLNEKLSEYGKAVREAITAYKDNLDNFKLYLREELEAVGEIRLTIDEEYFFDTIKEDLAAMENALRKDSIALSKSSRSLTVEVKLNDSLTCVMIVDTGASVVSITKNTAGQLGIDLSGIRNDIELTVADGSVIRAKAVYLKSVQVGDSRAEDVIAAVVDNPPGPGVDGLLGMSFLNNFGVTLDSANNKLILDSVR
jgi:clan AA aspartic protease (TIGR02281 family)